MRPTQRSGTVFLPGKGESTTVSGRVTAYHV